MEDLEGGEVDEGAEEGDIDGGEDEEAEAFGLFGLKPPGDAVIEDAHGEGDADGPADPGVDGRDGVEEASVKDGTVSEGDEDEADAERGAEVEAFGDVFEEAGTKHRVECTTEEAPKLIEALLFPGN